MRGRLKACTILLVFAVGAFALVVTSRAFGSIESARFGIVFGGAVPGPRLNVSGSQFVQFGGALRFDLTASDYDHAVDALRFSATGLPLGLDLRDHLDGTATISGTVVGPARKYDITVAVVDPDGVADSKRLLATVMRREVGLVYTGSVRAGTGSPITLAATLTQSGGSPADLTRASVIFVVTDRRGTTTAYGPVATSPGGLALRDIPAGLSDGIYSVNVQIDPANDYFSAPASNVSLVIGEPSSQLSAVRGVADWPLDDGS